MRLLTVLCFLGVPFLQALGQSGFKKRNLTCPVGHAISSIWYQEKDGGLHYEIKCANVTNDCHAVQCEWQSAWDPTACANNSCFIQGIQVAKDLTNASMGSRYLFCHGTAKTGACSSNPKAGDKCVTNALQCRMDVHPIKAAMTVNPTLAEQSGLQGLEAFPGIAILKGTPTAEETPSKKTICKGNKCSEEEANILYGLVQSSFVSREVMSESTSRQQFKDNLDKLRGLQTECSLNPGDATFDIGKFGDLSIDQATKYLGGAITGGSPPEAYEVRKRYLETWKQHNHIDWREYKQVPEVRDQGLCGASYAFAVSDLIAIQGYINRKEAISANTKGSSYSAQFILDCFQAPQAYGCRGGRPFAVLKYLETCGQYCALPSEACYSYNGNNTANMCEKTRCNDTKTGTVKWLAHLTFPAETEKENMANLLRWGPVLSAIEISPSVLMYQKGILRGYQCGSKPNHPVVIVGYDYSGDIPYYIVKNSWGTTWGEEGYAKIEAGVNACGIATELTSICVDNKCDQIERIDDVIDHPNAPK